MIDTLFATIGALCFISFCAVLITYVPHTDLVIVIVLVILMVCFDFVRELFFRKRNGKR